MYRLWICLLCSVVVRAFLGVRGSLENVQRTDVEPTEPVAYARSEQFVQNGTVAPSTLLGIPVASALWRIRETIKTPFLILTAKKEVCFENLGCFPLEAPWRSIVRPIGEPSNPKVINVSVSLFSRENPKEPIIKSLYPEINLENITFNAQRTNVFIVHGFASSGSAEWVRNLKDAYLNARDANVFTVDWSGGAQKINYLLVTSNTRIVGRLLGLLIEKLVKDFGAQMSNFHLIGHSLGSHICAYAAKANPGIGRLTALDPAQPAFEGFSKTIRLDKSDAEFVEVYHTDARPLIPTVGFGMIGAFGHVDFYFNGGFSQPGCLIPKTELHITDITSLGKYPVEVISEVVACPHSRAYHYYTEALNTSKCTFWGHKAQLMDSIEITTSFVTQGYFNFNRGMKCTPDKCIPLGLDAINSRHRGSFMVFTKNSPPYCKG